LSYPDTEERVNGPSEGDRIFLFVAGKGVVAVGRVGAGPAFRSDTIFRGKFGNEHDRPVTWEDSVAPDEAVTIHDTKRWGYYLPVRLTLCRMRDGEAAEKIAAELHKRAAER
jgi:hypothetical protein